MITKYENQELTDNEKYVQMEGQYEEYEEYEEYKQEQEQQIYTKLLMKYDNLMILKIFLSNNDETFSNIYEEAINKHNHSIMNDEYPDSGFDLFSPNEIVCKNDLIKLDLNIRCSARMLTSNWKDYNTGFYLYPRSSIMKTPLRLSNSVGIIDSGYRNNIIAFFDNNESLYEIKKYSRLVQICNPILSPIFVIKVNDENELSNPTTRGFGGFGSTDFNIENLIQHLQNDIPNEFIEGEDLNDNNTDITDNDIYNNKNNDDTVDVDDDDDDDNDDDDDDSKSGLA
jgi:dUTP pyrophosphatase